MINLNRTECSTCIFIEKQTRENSKYVFYTCKRDGQKTFKHYSHCKFHQGATETEEDRDERIWSNGYLAGVKEAEEGICKDIERLIQVNKTKNGFPAGTLCAVRIEAYEALLSLIGKKK